MDEDSPNGSPYETLAKNDQSETKCDITPPEEIVVAPCYVPVSRDLGKQRN
jgi:hypothetical protein